MPPSDSATGLGGGGGIRVEEAGGRKCQQQLRGGLLIRAVHAGEESEDGLDSPKLEQYPQKETNVGKDHQADIPSMLLTEAERAADMAAMEETAEMGGTAVWSSVRDWTASERERLDRYLEEARRAADEKRMSPGVPALISINNGGDRRRKRKMAWAVMAGGKPEDEEKLRVGCAGGGVSEVSRSELQPTQVEELAMQALMREDAGNNKGKGSLIDNARTALVLLDNTMVDDSGPLATWTGPQIEALSKALEAHFDADRFTRSRGHERHRDEHTDVTSLIDSVDGKTPSQVLSFYYRYMATGDALTEVMGSAEAQAKVRSERRSASLRGPPAPRPSPPPNLRHRPSLRCPTRLQASSFEDSGDSDDGDIAVGSYQLRTRRSSRNDRRGAAAATAAATGSAGNKGSAGKAVGSSTNSTNSTTTSSSSRGRGNNNNDDGGGDGVGSSRSKGSNNNNNSSDDSGGGGTGPVTRQPADQRRASAPEEEEEDGTASSRGRVGSRPPAGWAQGGRRGTAAAEAFGGGEEGRGCKRSFDDHRAPPDDVRGGAKEQRAPQRPRWQQDVPQQSVPADAVIVEVSDDEEPAAARLKLALAAAAASTTTAAAAAVSAAVTNVSVSNGRGMTEARGPAFIGGTAGDVMAGQRRHGHTGYPHEGGAPAFARRVDERRKDSRVVADQRQHHHDRRYSDYPYDGYTITATTTTTANHSNNSNNNNLHHRRYYHHTTNNNNGFEGNQHHQRNSGYGFGYGYGSSNSSNSSNNLGGREPRFQPVDRHSRHLAAASSGVRASEMGAPAALGRNVSASMRGPPQQPGPVLDGSWRSGGGGGRGVVSGVGVGGRPGGSTPAFRRRTDELTPMEKCWMLVDFARKDGLPTDRVEYLKGLLRTHEKKSMTFRMLTERTDSCLYDREDIQKGFVEIFGEMELPEPRSSAYRNTAAVALPGADYTTGGGYGVSSRSTRSVIQGGGGNGNVSASSYYLHHSGSSRNDGGGGGGAAATGYLHHAATAAALPSVGDAAMRVGSHGLGRRVLPPPSALGLMSGMRRLGEGTSMARLSSGGVVPTAAAGAAAAASMSYPTSAPVAAGASR
ncbi:unnamed protein product [Ectocarpus sp. 13 AM-2016]